MSRPTYAEQLNHLKILKMCEGIITSYFTDDKILTKKQEQRMAYAVDMYKRTIPADLNLGSGGKGLWTDLFDALDNRSGETPEK